MKIFSPSGNKEPSEWKPTDEEKEMLLMISKDFEIGYQNMTKAREEFNDRNVIDYVNDNKRNFNSYVPPKSSDPDEAWRAQTVRPITRNRLISIAAHITATLLYPKVSAQDENSDEDKDAANVMRDIMEWVIDNSDYERVNIMGVITALWSPALILEASYVEAMRKVRERLENGEVSVKEVLDEELSGFQASVVPVDELYIANVYQHHIQRQRFLIRRRFISYDEAKAIYGEHPNFDFVKAGVKFAYSPELDTFYQQRDTDISESQVELCIYYNRFEDLEQVVINGILVTDVNQGLKRKDKRYPFAKTGFEYIDEGRFFYFKSAADKIGSDQELVNTLYNMVIDGTFLSLMPPHVLYGDEEIDASVVAPGAITALSENTKLEAINIRSDLRGGLQAIEKVESSISESTQDPMQAGQAVPGERTAYETSKLQMNAAVALDLFARMIGFVVKDFGKLLVSDILQHMTVATVEDLISGESALKFRSFVLPDKLEGSRRVTKKIVFTNDLPNEMTEKEQMDRSFDLLDEQGGMESDRSIALVNPELFRERNYYLRVSVDELQPKSEALQRALNLEAYDRMIQNPRLDQDAVTRDFLVEAYKPGDWDKYKMKSDTMQAMGMGAGTPNPQGVNQNMTGQLTGSNSLKNAQLNNESIRNLV